MGNLEKQDLDEVNEELRAMNLLESTVPLPRYAGGGEVGVLLGIQDVHLDPVLVGVLPSGTGIYRCLFVDMWGSQFAYGGPHPSFSASTNVGHMSSLFMKITTTAPEERKSTRKVLQKPSSVSLRPARMG